MATVEPKGITFTGAMVRAVLAGHKIQTRRTKGRPYAPGDVLLIGEAWRTWARYDDLSPTELPADASISYEADEPAAEALAMFGRYRHARFLPFRFRRLRLIVEAERREPLQQITEADAQAEGIQPIPYASGAGNRFTVRAGDWNFNEPTAAAVFRRLWEHINGPGSWEATTEPVRVVTFRRAPDQ